MARRVVVSLATVLLIAIIGWTQWLRPLYAVPTTQAQLEKHWEREILDYKIIDGVPMVVDAWGPADDPLIVLDVLQRDLVSKRHFPGPDWQWTGDWATFDRTDDPASAYLSSHPGPQVLVGQLNDLVIVKVVVERDTQRLTEADVEGGGYILNAADIKPGDTVIFLDATGTEVWRVVLTN